jgi:hypothetical protein
MSYRLDLILARLSEDETAELVKLALATMAASTAVDTIREHLESDTEARDEFIAGCLDES